MPLTPTDPTKAQIWIRGEAPNQIIDLYVPRGAKGEPGGFTSPTNIPAGADLNAYMTPGLYRKLAPAEATLLLNFPKEALAGSLRVYERAGGYGWQEYEGLTAGQEARVVYRRAFVNSTFMPWRVVVTQRVDQTAGRAIYTWDDINAREQLVWGDTGVRVLTLDNGFVGSVAIRRIGSTVNAVGTVQRPPGGSLNGTFLAAIPSGFVPASNAWVYTAVRHNGVNATFWLYRRATELVFTDSIAGNETDSAQVRFDVTWTTAQAWPTTLPGTASGSIPNT